MHQDSLPKAEEKIKLLISKGADPNLPYTDEYGSKYFAVIQQFCAVSDLLEILLKNGGNPNLCDEEGNTLAHNIVGIGGGRSFSGGDEEKLQCLKILKNFGANISAVNNKNESILYAPRYNNILSKEIILFALKNACKPMTETEKAQLEKIQRQKSEGYEIERKRYNSHYYIGEDPLDAKKRYFDKYRNYHPEDVVGNYKRVLKEKAIVEKNNKWKEDNSKEGIEHQEEGRKLQEELFRYQINKKTQKNK